MNQSIQRHTEKTSGGQTACRHAHTLVKRLHVIVVSSIKTALTTNLLRSIFVESLSMSASNRNVWLFGSICWPACVILANHWWHWRQRSVVRKAPKSTGIHRNSHEPHTTAPTCRSAAMRTGRCAARTTRRRATTAATASRPSPSRSASSARPRARSASVRSSRPASAARVQHQPL